MDVHGEHLGHPRLEHPSHHPRGADAALSFSPIFFFSLVFAVFVAASLPEPELVRDAVDLDGLVALEVEHTIGVGPVFLKKKKSKIERERERDSEFFFEAKKKREKKVKKLSFPLFTCLHAGSRSLTATMSCSAALWTQGQAASTDSKTSISSVARSVASLSRFASTNASERAKPGCERIEAYRKEESKGSSAASRWASRRMASQTGSVGETGVEDGDEWREEEDLEEEAEEEEDDEDDEGGLPAPPPSPSLSLSSFFRICCRCSASVSASSQSEQKSSTSDWR